MDKKQAEMNKTDFKEAITCIESHSQTSEGYEVETEAGTFTVTWEQMQEYFRYSGYGNFEVPGENGMRDIEHNETFNQFHARANESEIEDFLKDYFKDNWEKIYSDGRKK